MAIQIIDDMLDSPIDHRDDVHNIFLHLLGGFPDELEAAANHFKQLPYNHLDWVWANQHLPNTCRKTVEMIARYAEKAYALSEDKSMILELYEIVLDWRLLAR
jgi:hypothetical protein